MASGRAARRLAELAAPLKPGRAPFYVRPPVPPGLELAFPAPGWYWVPPGHAVAVYLAYSYAGAVVRLHQLTEAQIEEETRDGSEAAA